MSMSIARAWKKPLLYSLLAVVLIGGLYLIYLGWINKDMTDFGVCYKAGQRILNEETLYRITDGHLQYKYAPVSALLYGILGLLPYGGAKVVWFYGQVLCLFACLWIAYRTLPKCEKSPWFIFGFGFAVLAKFIGREFVLGQVNLLILLLLMGTLWSFLKNKDVWAGVLMAVSLFFKPYAVVLLPYFLLKKRPRVLAAGLVALGAGIVAPAAFFGWQGNLAVHREWVTTLSMSTPGLLAVGDNASIYAFFSKELGGSSRPAVKILFFASIALLAGILIWIIARSRRIKERPEFLELAFLFVLIPFLSPLGWYYNYLYSLPAVVLLLNDLRLMAPAWKYALILNLAVIGGTLREILGKTLFRVYTHHSLVAVNYIIVLAALVYMRAKEIA
jgi:hypothetical protein